MRSASLIFYRFSTNGDHHDTAIEQCDRRNRIGDFGCRDGSGPATSAADNVDNDPTDAGRISNDHYEPHDNSCSGNCCYACADADHYNSEHHDHAHG